MDCPLGKMKVAVLKYGDLEVAISGSSTVILMQSQNPQWYIHASWT